MLSDKEFVRQSVDLNLFFMRIMKEHMFFIQAAFTPKNQNLSQQSGMLKNMAEKVLAEAVSISDGLVSPQVAKSGELVTDLTIQAERVTQFYTGINFNTRLTEAERGLSGAEEIRITPGIIQRIEHLNQRAINVVRSIIAFKERLLNDVLECKLFTLNYPLLIDHILREAKLYLSMLTKLQNRKDMDFEKNWRSRKHFGTELWQSMRSLSGAYWIRRKLVYLILPICLEIPLISLR